MNIFLPYCSNVVTYNDIINSVWSLDDKRLIKQILEVYEIFQVSIGENTGWSNHPIVKHYKDFPTFLITYGLECCYEYTCRFGKHHKYEEFFLKQRDIKRIDKTHPLNSLAIPFYEEGKREDINSIRTFEDVDLL